jgi:hypothetical protein
MNIMIRRTGRQLALRSLVFAFALALAAPTAWAKKQPTEVKQVEQRYTLPYALTVMAVGIGVAAVCMPSRRKTEVPLD